MSIIAGVSSGDRSTSQLAKLDSLRFGPGYLQDSSVVGSNETTLAPYLSGYLLEALGIECRGEEMRFLLDNLWTLMAQPGDDYSGGSWEYVVRICIYVAVLSSGPLTPCVAIVPHRKARTLRLHFPRPPLGFRCHGRSHSIRSRYPTDRDRLQPMDLRPCRPQPHTCFRMYRSAFWIHQGFMVDGIRKTRNGG